MTDTNAEFLGDVIARLIEGDMTSGECWRPAATLDFLVQGLVILAEDGDEDSGRREMASDIIEDVATLMTYLEVEEPLSDEATIERDVDLFREALDRLGKEDNNNKEEK